MCVSQRKRELVFTVGQTELTTFLVYLTQLATDLSNRPRQGPHVVDLHRSAIARRPKSE